jgi:phosphate:Na+ symporter
MMQAGIQTSDDIELLALAMGLFGGLALFLYGMDKMSDALKAVAGDRMRQILARLTSNRFMGVITGAFTTAVIQSSSVTTVLVVGFITAGLMTVAQSIGVIMGANIGTTITAQIIAFKVTHFSLAMVAVGFAMMFFAKRDRTRHHGAGIMGLGLVFLGMSVMGDAMRPLRSYQPFLQWMLEMEVPWVGILAGALFTALVQSSSATTGVVIVMASQGLIALPAGIAVCLGANIGTCVSAVLAAVGKPREAMRAAGVHVLFNIAGVALWYAFIHELAGVATWISPSGADVPEADRLGAVTPRQIANAHSVFNVANTLIFVGFVPVFGRLIQFLVPDRPMAEEAVVRAKYLDDDLMETPFLALDRARLELLHLGELVQAMLADVLPAMLHGTREQLLEVRRRDDRVDQLYGQIVTYLGKTSKETLTEAETKELIKLMEAANGLESIGDVIETNLVGLGLQRIENGMSISPQTQELITRFHGVVLASVESAMTCVTQMNERAAQHVVAMKRQISDMLEEAAEHGARRLVAAEPQRLPAYAIETDMLSNLQRVYYYAKRIARTVLPSGLPPAADS